MMRFRPRFSVQTLSVVVTLICIYLGAWNATQKYGVPLESAHVIRNDENSQPRRFRLRTQNEGSPLPFIIGRDEIVQYSKPYRRYYVWLFGPTFTIPIEFEPTRREAFPAPRRLPDHEMPRRSINRPNAPPSKFSLERLIEEDNRLQNENSTP